MAVLANILNNSKTNTAILVNIDDEKYDCEIVFESDKELSEVFLSCIDSSFGACLKTEYNMDSNIGPFMKLNDVNYSFEKYINSLNNKLLASYINQYVDLYKILIEKISSYGIRYIDNYSKIFCDKERDMILEIFGINDMLRRRNEKSQDVYKCLYEQEDLDIDNAVKTLNRFKK